MQHVRLHSGTKQSNILWGVAWGNLQSVQDHWIYQRDEPQQKNRATKQVAKARQLGHEGVLAACLGPLGTFQEQCLSNDWRDFHKEAARVGSLLMADPLLRGISPTLPQTLPLSCKHRMSCRNTPHRRSPALP